MLLPLAVWAVSNLYDWRHKETDLLGKMMVAFSLSQLFVLGGVAVGPTGQPPALDLCRSDIPLRPGREDRGRSCGYGGRLQELQWSSSSGSQPSALFN